ncbi:MAG: HD-GYP domain-containing protein [Anaerolineae bacterium]|nr:HD-GYP domain-containing protein [Anaerolineae bacterium]MCI0610617.1 HD-GYP domain-containing protein [Anaerolineae bacterium]
MIKQATDIQAIQRQFQDVHTLLMNVVDGLSRTGNPIVSAAIQDVTRVSQTVQKLEQGVNDHLQVRQSQLGALMGVGRTINSSLGSERVLEEVMDTLIALMRAERGFLMLRESNGELKVRIARGIAHNNVDEEILKVSNTIMRKVAASGESILTTNAQQDPRFENQVSVAAYQLRSILCAPLKIKNDLIGVIYVDNRAHAGIFRESDLALINAFADQAAVAIDNARLFENLKMSNFQLEAANLELKIAYEATLNGWVRALDMRDKETEGHTQRVTILTEKLARLMGVDGDEMVHITRGALLHDIGKMAIPDGILLKPGQLTDDERKLIQKHPVYAYEMLSPIEFLRPALDIPYCHHEKWDGTGYPRGLTGEDIPFAARIFPVIDVWDALTSDRPYRKGLPQDVVRQHIQADSGKHFDPRVVNAFFELGDLSV